jgi:hypothetical protein
MLFHPLPSGDHDGIAVDTRQPVPQAQTPPLFGATSMR